MDSKLRIVLVHETKGWEYADKLYELANGKLNLFRHTKLTLKKQEKKPVAEEQAKTSEECEKHQYDHESNESSRLLDSVIDIDNVQPDEADKPKNVYSKYFNLNECSGFLLFVFLVLCFVAFQAFIITADTWAIYWARQESKLNNNNINSSYENITSLSHNNQSLMFNADEYFRQSSLIFYSSKFFENSCLY